jgi:hypothetical protein
MMALLRLYEGYVKALEEQMLARCGASHLY